MLFSELLDQETKVIQPILDEVFNLALQNQTHPQDLFLVMNQGYYEKKLEGNDIGLINYVLGLPGMPGMEYASAYEFIHAYREQMVTSLDEYDAERVEFLKSGTEEDFRKGEFVTIQVEQLIYLKFWESNFIIRQFYQLARLINKETYDWDFDLSKRRRKQVLTESVRNRIEPFNKPFADLLDACYNSQIRNAIAHSLFFRLGDTIMLTNHNHNKSDILGSITFETWRMYIHKTLVIFNELIRIRKEVDNYYGKNAQNNNNTLQYRLHTKSHNEMRKINYFPDEMNKWGISNP